jgi:hypothetical protein
MLEHFLKTRKNNCQKYKALFKKGNHGVVKYKREQETHNGATPSTAGTA